tara:strand:- start:1074 stop:1550 length:477 start_codon:yes stop_codon:yes gene_type:complete
MKTVNREQLAVEVELHRQKGSKGLLVLGEPGMGKTYSLKTHRMVSAIDLALDYQTMGIESVKEKINAMMSYEGLKVTIDDLGSEDRVKNFGTDLDPIAFVIQKIYSINQINPDQPVRLFMTSNFLPKTLTEKYGERVMDRLYELCDIVNLKDTNLRRI